MRAFTSIFLLENTEHVKYNAPIGIRYGTAKCLQSRQSALCADKEQLHSSIFRTICHHHMRGIVCYDIRILLPMRCAVVMLMRWHMALIEHVCNCEQHAVYLSHNVVVHADSRH